MKDHARYFSERPNRPRGDLTKNVFFRFSTGSIFCLFPYVYNIDSNYQQRIEIKTK